MNHNSYYEGRASQYGAQPQADSSTSHKIDILCLAILVPISLLVSSSDSLVV
jgi:hypothetical protein